jgi:hypothetical protein
MLYHVVVITVKDDVTDARVDAVLDGFRALSAAIPEIRAYNFGRDAGLSQNRFSLALVARFDSVEDFTIYRDHPSHQVFVRDLLGPIAQTRESTQFFSQD